MIRSMGVVGFLGLFLVTAGFVVLKSEVQIQQHSGPWTFGQVNARWTVTEFADLECPYCKTYTPALKAWVQQQKNVNLQWHHLPLDFHGSAALYEAKLAECAGQLGGATVFWQAIDQILELTKSNGQGFNGRLNVSGVSHTDMMACTAKDDRIATRISEQVKDATQLGVSATPAVIVKDNTTGKTIKIEGPADGTMLLSAIDLLSQQN